MSRFGQDPIPGMPDKADNVSQSPPFKPLPQETSPQPSVPPLPDPVSVPQPNKQRITGFRVLNGPWAGDVVEVPDRSDDVLIGRNDPPGIVVDIDLTEAELGKPPMISRRHASVRSGPNGEVTIHDVGSTNGTWVDHVRLRPGEPSQPIGPGTLLRFANIEMVAMSEGQP